MSEPILRPTTEEDLPALSDLTDSVFGRRREPELLRWLLLSNEPGLELESKVAEKDGRVVGHVAVLLGRYRWQRRLMTGSHPLLWMVVPGSRGRAGVRLGRWCLGHGDFTMIVGGTQTSRTILAKRHFVRSTHAVELRFDTAAGDSGERGEWELTPYDATAGAGDTAANGPLLRVDEAPILRWLAACPELESQLFTLRRSGTPTGPVLLYVDRRLDPPRGRIVHLPWSDGNGQESLRLVLDRLTASGCDSASLLATHPTLIEAARGLGGAVFYERPVFCRAAGDRLPREPAWHLSYLEGDLAYRHV